MLEKLKALFAKWFGRKESPRPITPSSTEPSYTSPPPYNPFTQYRGWLLQEVIIKLGHGLTDAEIEQAKAAGVIVRETVTQGPVDRSGFHLGGEAGDGDVRDNPLEDDLEYVYTYFIRPTSTSAEIWVFGSRGTQVLEVNGKRGDESRFHRVPLLPGLHSFGLTKKSVGKDIAVQLRQS